MQLFFKQLRTYPHLVSDRGVKFAASSRIPPIDDKHTLEECRRRLTLRDTEDGRDDGNEDVTHRVARIVKSVKRW